MVSKCKIGRRLSLVFLSPTSPTALGDANRGVFDLEIVSHPARFWTNAVENQPRGDRVQTPPNSRQKTCRVPYGFHTKRPSTVLHPASRRQTSNAQNPMNTQKNAQPVGNQQDGGQGGIRTLGDVSATHAFQACSFDHSDTCPCCGGRDARKRNPAWQILFDGRRWKSVWRP